MTTETTLKNAVELERIRRQFDFGPYPRIPLDKFPKDETNSLFIHDVTTPYYLAYQTVVNPKDLVILDAGCGSGYKSLLLAMANPGAKIVGIDLSEASVHMARERLAFHQFENVEFHTLTIEEVPGLGLAFDYINCDEVLYLVPDPVKALQAMGSVLKPRGILRANLHSYLQRAPFFRAQAIFRIMGMMDNNPEEMEMKLVQEIMAELKDGVDLKARAWNPKYQQEDAAEALLANHLLVGDCGFNVSDMFNYLDQAGLDFIGMVNWRQWSLEGLFKDPENLPSFLAMSLPDVPQPTQLELYELFHPVHRLLDFWCHKPQPESESPPPHPADWPDEQILKAQVYLHPQLCTETIQAKWKQYIQDRVVVDLGTFLSITSSTPVYVDSLVLSCLLPLFDGPQSLEFLVNRWLQICPCDLMTAEPLTPAQALAHVRQFLHRLEPAQFVLCPLPT